MGWQEAIALTIVAVTVLAFTWSWLRPRKVSFRRQTGCGCSEVPAGSRQSITLHARKGERPQVIVKAG